MAVQRSVPDPAAYARDIAPASRNDGRVFGILDTRALSFLPSGIAYASLPYRCHAISPAELAPLDRALPDTLASAAPKRRIEHLAGRLCARATVHQLTGTLAGIGIAASGAPVWPPRLTGSISHSHGRAVAVAAWRANWGALGVDIEARLPAVTAGELAPFILTANERRRFAGIIDPGFLTMAFSIKEALFKALHPMVNRFFDHHGARIVEYDPGGTATLQLTQDLSGDWREGRRLKGRFWCSTGHCITLIRTGNPKCSPN